MRCSTFPRAAPASRGPKRPFGARRGTHPAIAGTAGAVGRRMARARGRGAKKTVLLPVSAPFHCALMTRAAERLAVDLAALPLRDARVPVVLNVGARPETRAEALRAALVEQVTMPVRWVESVLRMQDMGSELMVEVGPGRCC